ncbi:disease resistance protein (TIR-NBS-LRR class) [Medicago truncatula]|uniref:Disease resistance protein (TIR-NBS-LRR class) n=1 Tax=Medicago truncatula TaxID=3880 RepID=A0A072UCB6_MEDTR|nr:disease resistance protein (TIR-NBS-LRR class) [Medicago truncatula]
MGSSDTRSRFTSHLYTALYDKGIHIDDCDLKRGDEITPSVVIAIEESRIFIPVLSINYASSKFCLEELVQQHTCSYGEDLTKHEEKFQNNKKNMERSHQWKIALTQSANLSGHPALLKSCISFLCLLSLISIP